MKTRKALVVGRGVIGLMTARALRRRGIEVVCVGRECLTGTTSAVAGGFWLPFHCLPVEAVERWSIASLRFYEAERTGSTAFASLIEKMPAVQLFEGREPPPPPGWVQYPEVKLETICDVDSAKLGEALDRRAYAKKCCPLHFPAAYASAYVFDTVVVDSPLYLAALEAELHADPKAELIEATLDFDSARRLALEKGCDALVNCTGLDGADLATDDSEAKTLVGGRGVVLSYKRHTEMNCVLTTDGGPLSPDQPTYIIPRGDVLVCGGSYDEEDALLKARPEELARITRATQSIAPSAVLPERLVGEFVGLRPVRIAGVRHEVMPQQSHGLTIAHNYGHGGSGWTVGVGCAEEIAALLAGGE